MTEHTGSDEPVQAAGLNNLTAHEEAQAEGIVRAEMGRLREFASGLSAREIRSGDWFAKFLSFSLGSYTANVDADFLRRKYPDLPVDAVVDARIRLAARYASIEGGLSATAYTTALAATMGSGGAASPFTVPAALTAFGVDMTFLSQLQLRTAWDISVLYGVDLDPEDPEDLWHLIRVAFAIKVGETGGGALVHAVPAVVRPMVKRIFSRGTLRAVKSLPVVGKHLLQRNIVKFAMPGVTIPLTATVNYWTTKVSGDYAKSIFRREARMLESAARIVSATRDHEALAWALWHVARGNGKGNEQRDRFLHFVTREMRQSGENGAWLDGFREVIEPSRGHVDDLLSRLDGDAPAVLDACMTMAAVPGSVDDTTRTRLAHVAEVLGLEVDNHVLADETATWQRVAHDSGAKATRPRGQGRRAGRGRKAASGR